MANENPADADAPKPQPIIEKLPKPVEVDELLTKVDRLLKEEQPEKALELISRTKTKSPWATNAVGVCQLRLGNAKVAVEVYRGLVLSGGIHVRGDVPAVFKTNFACALLQSNNLAGCLSVLGEMREEEHAAVGRLKLAIQRWKKELTFWQRITWYTGVQPDRPVELGFLPGDIE